MTGEIASTTVEVVKKEASKIAAKGLEKTQPFADSARPVEGRVERPQLKDSGKLSETRQFVDSDRPFNKKGIEQPKLKTIVETGEGKLDMDKKIPCRNEELAGKMHPVTGVPFEKKSVVVEGKEKEVVVPKFESHFDAHLSKDKLKASDAVQFKECNIQLKEAVSTDSRLQTNFTDEELEQIENGDTPDGYTWHHDAEEGKMQLVDTQTHQQTGHTGGRNIWGGGSDSR